MQNEYNFMDLSSPKYSYMLGFLQTDGHLTSSNKKGKLTVEISTKDKHILEEFQKITPYYSNITERTRNTNFKNNAHSATWTVSILECREKVNKAGVPVGIKSKIIEPPEKAEWNDYVRGLVDGDGSLGFTAKGIPFITLTTSSEKISEFFIGFLEPIVGYKKTCFRNKRDDIYVITITRDDAKKFCEIVYYDNCLSLKRKYEKSKLILKWNNRFKKIIRKRWSRSDDKFILENTIKNSCEILKRTEKSVKTRLWKLNKKSSRLETF